MSIKLTALAFVSLVGTHSSFGQAMQTVGIPNADISLLPASGAEARLLLHSLMTNAPALENSTDILRYAAVLTNNGSKPIVGYTIDWTVTDASGRKSHRYTSVSDFSALGALSVPAGGTALNPKSFALVTPTGRIPLSDLKDMKAGVLRAPKETGLEAIPATAQSVSSTVDDVIYSDGMYAGPDRSGNTLRTRMDWNARHDSGISALKAAAKYPSDADLQDYLEAYPSKREPSNGSPAHDLYYDARERATANLLFALKALGRNSLLLNARNFADQKPLMLKPFTPSAPTPASTPE